MCAAPPSCAASTPEGWFEIDSTSVDEPGRVEAHVNPYHDDREQAAGQGSSCARKTRLIQELQAQRCLRCRPK